jgi:hypothetical protein
MRCLSRWSALPLLFLIPACSAESPSAPAVEDLSPSLSTHGTPANAVLRVLNVQLTAAAETPHVSNSQAGGHAQIKIHPGGRIAWKGRINNRAGETFTAGHIHVITNPTTRTGPPVLWLFGPTSDDGRHIDFEGEATNQALADALMANSSNYYVNFHTTDIPPGAIRGDL